MGEVYRFGPFVLDPARRTLLRDGAVVALTPKAFDILIFLAQNPHRVITKQELMKAVWSDTFVEEGNLTQNISVLRKALGERSEESRLIVTLARQGYQFTADVIVNEPEVDRSRVESQDQKLGRSPFVLAGWGAAVFVMIAAGYIIWYRSRVITPPRSERVRLAVLPFQNLTGDPRQDYLGDGLTEELITQLTRLAPQQLGVIARTSVMGYKNTSARLDQIGRDLSVQYALESSFRRSANRLRITIQLVQVQDQSHLWAGNFDYSPHDTLSLESEVSIAAAREIQLRLNPQQIARLKRSRRVDPAAFDAYLQGRYFFDRAGKNNLDSATRYFQRAIRSDSGYAPAWVWLSDAWRRAGDRGYVSAEEGNRQARACVDRAVSLDPTLAEAHAQLGWIRMLVDWDWTGADAAFKRALDLDPGNAAVATGASVIAAKLGRLDEAVELARRSVDLDPLNPEAIGSLGQLFYDMGRFPEAAANLRRSLNLFKLPHASELLALVYLAQDRADSALVAVEKETSPVWQLHGRALVYHALDRRSPSDSALHQFTVQYGAAAAYQVAEIYAFRGETDRAFEWLDRAYAQQDQGLSSLKRDLLVKNLRADSRYPGFLKRMRLPL